MPGKYLALVYCALAEIGPLEYVRSPQTVCSEISECLRSPKPNLRKHRKKSRSNGEFVGSHFCRPSRREK